VSSLIYEDPHFKEAYYKAHPSADPETTFVDYKILEYRYITLFRIYLDMLTLSTLSPEEKFKASHIYISKSSAIQEDNKLMWLFYTAYFPDEPYSDFLPRMRETIIHKNDTNLSAADYALLIYLSYEHNELQEHTEKLPLFMLADIYIPIADRHLESWYKSKNIIRDI
jgi:hypothetical protein